jgi:Papain family cysteine protease
LKEVAVYRTGLLQTDPANKLLRLPAKQHPPIGAALKTLKGSADLTSFAPRILNQGLSSTCWAHSAASLLYVRRRVLGLAPRLQSPLFFAQTLYGMYRLPKIVVGQPMPDLIDQGAQLDDAVRAFSKWGSVDFQGDGDTDVPATEDPLGNPIPLPETTVELVEDATGNLFGGPYDITPSALDEVAASLEAGIPVWIGALVGEQYQRLRAGEVAGPCPLDDPSAGGHAQGLMGYDTVAGQRQWTILNSWGKDWAKGGYGLVSDAFVATSWSLLPFEVNHA